jgi:hypothetical protein
VADRTAVLQVGDLRREVEQAPEPPVEVPAEPVEAPAARLVDPPRPPAARPSRPAPATRRRGPALALVVAALLLLGSAVGLGALLLGDGDNTGSTNAAGAAEQATQAPAEPEADVDPAPAGDEPAAEAPAAPSPQPAPSAAAEAAADGPVPPPDGWQGFTGGPGWEVFVPPSYALGSFRGTPEYRDNSTGRTLRVENTGPGGGGEDAAEDRRVQARSFASRYPSYEEIGISSIDYRGYEAADWEFTYAPGGTGLHALSRVFVVDGRGYSLFFQTRAGDDWAAARAEFDRIARSFVPA